MELQCEVREVRSQEKLGKQDFHYDVQELFESITKTVETTSEEFFEQSKAKTEEIEDNFFLEILMAQLKVPNKSLKDIQAKYGIDSDIDDFCIEVDRNKSVSGNFQFSSKCDTDARLRAKKTSSPFESSSS